MNLVLREEEKNEPESDKKISVGLKLLHYFLSKIYKIFLPNFYQNLFKIQILEGFCIRIRV